VNVSSSTEQRQSEPKWSRRFLRRAKGSILQHDAIYRLYLKLKYGANRVEVEPDGSFPNSVLKSKAEWRDAVARGRRLGLPLHRGEEKNWDHLAAIATIVSHTPTSATILDAGAEFYSNVLPALFIQGYRHLYGINLAFSDPVKHGPIQYLPDDITKSQFPDNFFDAVACMSVVEHGVSLPEYFREMHRILKPGGLLITSTDYFPTAIDTAGKFAHGSPVKIFTKTEMECMIQQAVTNGFELTGDVDFEGTERPVRWEQLDLEYTFIIFTLRKSRSELSNSRNSQVEN
jgi:hypothetical protein